MTTIEADTPEVAQDAGEEIAAAPSPEGEDTRPSSKVAGFVRDHPALVVGGGLVAGALAAALLPKGNRKRMSGLAQAATTAGIAYGRAAWERASETGHELRERGEDLAGRAGEHASRLGEAAASAGHRAIDQVTDKVNKIGSRLNR